MNRVVVTGIGIVSPLGNTIEDFWRNIVSGKNGISEINSFDTSGYDVHIAGQCKINLQHYFDKKTLNKNDKFTAYAIIAADQAFKDSNLDLKKINHDKSGVIIGSGIGGMNTFESQYKKLLKNPRRVSPFFIPSMIPDIAAGQVAIKYGFKGVNYSILSACASSSHCIGDAFRNIKHGYADIIITGGSESTITPSAIAGFSNMKALTKNTDIKTASRPFDSDRDGFVMGEGSGILVLEKLEHALNRNAKIYAEIIGYGATADAFHLTSPNPDGYGACKAMKLAIKESGLDNKNFQYINAHGTSTKQNDFIETKAIKKVFKDHSNKISISSTKSMIGHLLGASGSVEMISTILSIKNSIIPPTINYSTKDPDCDLDYVPNESISKSVDNALSNSFGFGGHNSVIAVGKYQNK
ncbi:MAG: beta-ketoacyl-[acyl-carrier-protein] synthase II [Candidatus Marinimicrobia bacterium]|nr:beta-ketoacyl-[acyl-carrier-protein] synthase II [Candidatus Neomarinimicrobiota bacterium]